MNAINPRTAIPPATPTPTKVPVLGPEDELSAAVGDGLAEEELGS